MADMVDYIELRCVTNGHNKFYCVWKEVSASGFGWVVNFKYGAIGAAGLSGSKTPSPVSQFKANDVYNRIVEEKIGKGYATYKKGSKAMPASVVAAVEAKASKKSMSDYMSLGLMMPTKDTLDNLEAYIKNPDWIGQQKLNGQFCRIFWTGIGKNEPIGFNKTGGIVELGEDIAAKIRKGSVPVILDGEIVGGQFIAVDALKIGNYLDIQHLASQSAEKRFDALSDYCASTGQVRVRSADDEAGKRELLKFLQEQSQEGMVFKLKAAHYEAGKATSAAKAVSVKVKFWKEVSAMVSEWNDKNSVRLVLREMVGGSPKMVFIGSCTVPEKYKKLIKDAGDDPIVRVKYLYATAANKLHQPSLDPDDDGNVVREDMSRPDDIGELVHEGDVKGEPARQITLD
jgi:hypothetical protein